MSEVREEYTRETYPSFGKKYNGEKAIISLTSWKARINTVSKTLFSLIQQCPGFHIVLVLSEEEFPKMCEELPENLMLFVENEMIELMFVYKNYKSFKKVLFTMDKYRDVPVISADDGCLYKENYAQQLYDLWLKNTDKICSRVHFQNSGIDFGGGGYGILYPPHSMIGFTDLLNDTILKYNNDDGFLGVLSKYLNIKWVYQNPLRCYPMSYVNFNNDERVGLFRTNSCPNNSTAIYKRLFNLT